MPATATAVNAKGCVVKLDNGAGTLTDISGSANEVNINMEGALGDYNVFGDDDTYRTEGVRNASIDVTIVFTTATNEGRDILKNWRSTRGARTLQVDVPNSASGSDRYMAEVMWEKMDLGLKVDEAKPITVKASLKPHGPIAESIVV